MHFLTKRDSTNAPDQDERPLTENIDTGFGVLYRVRIDEGTVHRELNRTWNDYSGCKRRAKAWGKGQHRHGREGNLQ